MKALTLLQPWATLVAIGAKKIETRSWSTSYRGPLAIHASKGFPKDAQHLCFQEPFRSHLGEYVNLGEPYFGNHKFSLGCVVATCELINVVQIDNDAQWVNPIKQSPVFKRPIDLAYKRIPPRERSAEFVFGDYTPGRYAWILANVQSLPNPIPAKGRLGLWEWEGPNHV